jgi:osmoprotectant transport system permease protein
MPLFTDAWTYFLADQPRFVRLLTQHLALSAAALALALSLCLPLGIWIAHRPRLAPGTLTFFNTLRILPSLVILFLALPYLGLGFRPALIALTILACPPLLINTHAGIRGVAPAITEAARGVGMSPWQLLRQIELPLALPVILTGVRIATVEVIASATLAAFIAGGGLGDYILRGFALNDPPTMLVGAAAVALLALTAEALFVLAQRAAARAAAHSAPSRVARTPRAGPPPTPPPTPPRPASHPHRRPPAPPPTPPRPA